MTGGSKYRYLKALWGCGIPMYLCSTNPTTIPPNYASHLSFRDLIATDDIWFGAVKLIVGILAVPFYLVFVTIVREGIRAPSSDSVL